MSGLGAAPMPDSGWRQVGLIGTSLAADVLLRMSVSVAGRPWRQPVHG